MTATQNLLVELFVEELPPKALKKLGEAFAAVLLRRPARRSGLADAGVAVTAVRHAAPARGRTSRTCCAQARRPARCRRS